MIAEVVRDVISVAVLLAALLVLCREYRHWKAVGR